jgi:hypothetical protein
MPIPEKGTQDYTDYVIALATRGTLREGIINEPRAFFDEVVVNPALGSETPGNAGVFYNGEQFPIRLTHLLGCVRFLNNAAESQEIDNEANINAVGLRLVFHDQYYMNPQMLPVPLWGNKPVAAAEVVSFGVSTWDFVHNGRPFVLSTRDTLVVDIQLQDAVVPETPVPITVQFSGFGMLSKRPYLFSSRRNLDALTSIAMPTTDVRNDGSEPVIITDMTVHVGAELGTVDPEGNISRLRFNIRQIGNGTNAKWFSGPQVPIAINRMQATLAGPTTGRAVVHEFPGDGLLWEPGEGITYFAANVGGDDELSSVLALGLLGYIMVR